MKILMKLAILMFISSFSINAYSQIPKKLWTIEQVKDIAKKYGMEDYISNTKNTALLYEKKEDIEKYFQNEHRIAENNKELKEYLRRTKDVKTYDDFLKLIEQYPTLKSKLEELNGGKMEFVKYNVEAQKYKWRIYRNASGGLAFERADLPIKPHELKLGRRIDNLPKF